MSGFDWTPEHEDLILHAYRTQGRPTEWLSRHPLFEGRWTVDQIRWKANRMGLRRKWRIKNPEVLSMMERYAGERPAVEIAAAINRKYRGRYKDDIITAEDVRRECSRRGWACRPDRLSQADFCRIFRVEPRVVKRWIDSGKLRATRDSENGHWSSTFRIKPVDVVRFLREYPWELEGGFFDIPWLMALFEELWVQCSANMRGQTRNGRGWNGKENSGDREADGAGAGEGAHQEDSRPAGDAEAAFR